MVVYKFSTMSEWLSRNIFNKVIFLNDPSNFNDPTENNFSLKRVEECMGGKNFKLDFIQSINDSLVSSYKEKDWVDFKNSSINMDLIKGKEIDQNYFIEKYADELLSRLNGEEIEAFCHRAVKDWQKEFRISSFTTNQSNPLMWGHYADGMRGVCIEYDINESDLDKVEYEECYKVDVMEVLASGGRAEDEVKKTFLRKNESWRYEEEYRIIRVLDNYYPVEKGQLTKIYFGYKCDEDRAEFIKDLAISVFGKDVELYITRHLVNSQYIKNVKVDGGSLKEELKITKKIIDEHGTFVQDEIFFKNLCPSIW